MKKFFPIAVGITLVAVLFLVGACTNSTTTSTASFKPGDGAVVNSDSIVTAKIQTCKNNRLITLGNWIF